MREIDKRLRFLGKRIESAEVVDPSRQQGKDVRFGATVTIIDEDEKQRTLQIVGEDEIDTTLGKISWRSPVARALLGKCIGDEVLVKKPKGDSWVEIILIEYK